jgi:capsular exopolysaccharide synthesis family protein
MEEKEYDIREILDIFLRKLWLIVLLCIAGGIIAFSYTKFMVKPTYTSSISLYVKNADSVSDDKVSSQDLTSSRALVDTYIVILQDNVVMKQLSSKLQSIYTDEQLSNYFSMVTIGDSSQISTSNLLSKITMEAENSTEILKISAETENAQLSADICNFMADIAPDFIIRMVGAGSVEMIGRAEPALSASSPNVPKNTAIGALIGVVIAMAIIFLMELLDNTIKSADVVVERYEIAKLGQVMDLSDGKKKKKASTKEVRHTILDRNVPFQYVEAFKAIRTNINFALSTVDKRIIAISSGAPSEGKSTVSCNIALTFAQANNKTLLIDADLRKPVQHQNFRLKNKVGLSTVLGKMNTIEEVTNKNVVENLDVITCGPTPPNPSEMLASSNMEELLDELSTKYDVIIIDTPPVNVVSDTLGLSNYISGLVLTIKEGESTYDEISQCINDFKLSNMNVLGFVLNGMDMSHGGYGYGYKYKYSKYSAYESYGNTKVNEELFKQGNSSNNTDKK